MPPCARCRARWLRPRPCCATARGRSSAARGRARRRGPARAGDLVPADARLLEARDLHVQQAALTGESLPAEKEVGDAANRTRRRGLPRHLGGQRDGDRARHGDRRATAFGDIAARLRHGRRRPSSSAGTRSFGAAHHARRSVFLVLFVFVVSVGFHRDPFESLLFAVALAVGLTPEFLPMITTVTLAQGAVRMARQKVIVKHLAAIQNFGSIESCAATRPAR